MSQASRSQQSPFTFSFRKKLVESYSELVRDELQRGMDAYYLSFMFNQLPGGPRQQTEQMLAEVERVRNILTRQVVRKPESPNWGHLRPVFIVCPDLPVAKHVKQEVRAFNVNDGLHVNAVVLVPPPPPCYLPRGVNQHPLFGKLSRLREPLDVHFEKSKRFYLTEKLYRIHVTPVRGGAIADYVFKNFKNGRVGYDDIRVF